MYGSHWLISAIYFFCADKPQKHKQCWGALLVAAQKHCTYEGTSVQKSEYHSFIVFGCTTATACDVWVVQPLLVFQFIWICIFWSPLSERDTTIGGLFPQTGQAFHLSSDWFLSILCSFGELLAPELWKHGNIIIGCKIFVCCTYNSRESSQKMHPNI